VISMCRGQLEPMAVIQHATLPTQRDVFGFAKDIYRLTIDQHITSPAVIVIGKVVNLKTLVNSLPQLREKDYERKNTL